MHRSRRQPSGGSRNSSICGAQIVALQRERQIGDDEAGLVAAIVADRVDVERVERLLADQCGHAVGQLDLAARALARPCRGSP